MAAAHRYLIALGSNQPHHRHGCPRAVIRAALEEIAARGIAVERVSPILATAPIGPSRRQFANAAVVVRTPDEPDALLHELQSIERDFGRTRGGQRWGARVLDLDIVLWEGGFWASDGLTVPHTAMRTRDFVLRPALAVAPDWRDPITGLTIRHLHARLTKPLPIPR